jgi:UDP-N-acetylmuramoyl-L-alanyl-D-glutamate--2,6-diaminopimelate ligase
MSADRNLLPLLAGITTVGDNRDSRVSGMTLDSRAVRPGDLFIALPGLRHDGRRHIPDAVIRGAAAVFYEPEGYTAPALAVPAIAVPRLREQLGVIASRFYDAPSRRLKVIGVTGTNGKTTCSQLLAQALDRPPDRCGVIGTLGNGFPGALDEGTHTTPDAAAVHRLLHEFLSGGARAVTMEVSSHALEQGRVNGVHFEVALFTNLSRDHLDYHGDMATYGAAKARLFMQDGLKAAIVNIEDEYGERLARALRDRVRLMAYGLRRGDVHARALSCSRGGIELEAVTPMGDVEIRSGLFGEFNAVNLLATLATLLALGLDPREAARRLAGARPVPGRVERFAGGPNRPLVVVDYAHTPDALEQVLKSLRPHAAGRLWCVFGCGGDRDRGKRPEMGAVAERLADVILLTDDNPRHESGDAIVDGILEGMRSKPRVIRDRRAAIATALAEAGPQDVVLIAGKGHEDYQQIGDVRHPYSDRETVRALLGLAA